MSQFDQKRIIRLHHPQSTVSEETLWFGKIKKRLQDVYYRFLGGRKHNRLPVEFDKELKVSFEIGNKKILAKPCDLSRGGIGLEILNDIGMVAKGQIIKLTLQFENHGSLQIEAEVRHFSHPNRFAGLLFVNPSASDIKTIESYLKFLGR